MDASPNTTPSDHALSVTVEGDTSALVPDLCHELSRELTWAEYGETMIPADAAPRGTITAASGEHVKGGMLISLDPNQPAPSTSRATPSRTCQKCVWSSLSQSRLTLTTSTWFIQRRADVCRVLSTVNGEITATIPPFVFTGRPVV